MKNGNPTRFARPMALVVCSSIAFMAHAQDATSFLKDWSFSGHYDLYYQFDGNNPGTSTTEIGRQFDITHNQFSLAVLQLNAVKKATAENPFGVTLQFTTGKNSEIINGNDDSSYQYVQQAFVTYAVPKSALTLDLGKWLTWVGYEGVVSADNDNYGRSFLFTLGEPIYHTGLRATYAATKTVTLNGYVVNGWNQVQSTNGGTSYGATAAYTPTAKLSLTGNYYGGNTGGASLNNSGFAGSGTANVQLADFIGTYQITDKLKFAVNADYADAKPVDTGDPSGHWAGVAVYLRDQISAKYGATVRAESFKDPNGLRTGFDASLSSLTGTFDIAGPGSSLLRFEIRYDRANGNVFDSSNGGMKDSRVTYTVAHVLRF